MDLIINIWPKTAPLETYRRNHYECVNIVTNAIRMTDRTYEIPKSTKGRNPERLATVLDLEVSNVVGRDEHNWCQRQSMLGCGKKVDGCVYTFGLPVVVSLFQNLHRIWTAAALLTVPQEETLWTDVTMDETTDSRAERLFLVGT